MTKEQTVFTRSRASSLLYEIAKGVSKTPATHHRQKRIKNQVDAKRQILNLNGLCEYCEVNGVGSRASSGDHYKPLVLNKMPTVYCEEPINMIPVCSKCNSSKQGNDFFEWFTHSPYCKSFARNVRRRVLKKMRRYETAFKKTHTTKTVPKKQVRTLYKKILQMLKEVDREVYAIKHLTKYS